MGDDLDEPFDDADEEAPVVEDNRPRTDIAPLVTDALVAEINDKNWKVGTEPLLCYAGLSSPSFEHIQIKLCGDIIRHQKGPSLLCCPTLGATTLVISLAFSSSIYKQTSFS